MFGEHSQFIIACYAISAASLGLLALWIVVDGRLVHRRLDELEARGVRRRSAGRDRS